MPTTYPSAKEVLGLAVEVTQGTAVTTLAATCPVKATEFEDKFVMLTDDSLRGSMVDTYGEVQGPKNTEFSINGPIFSDWFPYFLVNILGDRTTTGAGPYTHAISLLNSGTAQPSTLTLINGGQLATTSLARTYSGCALSELTIKGNPESTFLEWSAKGLGWASADYPTAPPTFSPSADAPMAAWRTGIGVGGTYGSVPNATIRNWEVTFTRELKIEWTSQNSQNPFIIQRGKLGIAGSFYVSVPADESMLDYWLNNSQPQLQFLIDNGQASTAQRRVTIDLQLGAFGQTKINRGEEAIGYDVTFKGVGNTTNVGASAGYGPAKVTVINNTATGY